MHIGQLKAVECIGNLHAYTDKIDLDDLNGRCS